MKNNTQQLKIWTGEFGKDYTERNIFTEKELDELYLKRYGVTRTALNKRFLKGLSSASRILEVGANVANQLVCLQKMGFSNLYGIEPQDYAVERSKQLTQGINIIKASAFDIPFKDNYFDLVCTSGVLIHINPAHIKKAMQEIYRCSAKFIWGFEYFANEYSGILYRGRRDLLWKADFAKMYCGRFNDLTLVKEERIKYLDNDNVDSMFLIRKKRKT
jgi:pseudaminic acid biosynthesis-associated methylase